MPARLALVCAALLAGCAPVVFLTAADAGLPLTLAVGDRIVIRLASNRTTGSGWRVAGITVDAIRQLGEASYVPDLPGAVGRGGIEELVLRAVAPGAGTLLLVYDRPFEPGAAPAETFAVPVTVR